MEGMKDEGGVEHPLSPSEEYLDAYEAVLRQSCCPQVFKLLTFMNIDAGRMTGSYAGTF